MVEGGCARYIWITLSLSITYHPRARQACVDSSTNIAMGKKMTPF